MRSFHPTNRNKILFRVVKKCIMDCWSFVRYPADRQSELNSPAYSTFYRDNTTTLVRSSLQNNYNLNNLRRHDPASAEVLGSSPLAGFVLGRYEFTLVNSQLFVSCQLGLSSCCSICIICLIIWRPVNLLEKLSPLPL